MAPHSKQALDAYLVSIENSLRQLQDYQKKQNPERSAEIVKVYESTSKTIADLDKQIPDKKQKERYDKLSKNLTPMRSFYDALVKNVAEQNAQKNNTVKASKEIWNEEYAAKLYADMEKDKIEHKGEVAPFYMAMMNGKAVPYSDPRQLIKDFITKAGAYVLAKKQGTDFDFETMKLGTFKDYIAALKPSIETKIEAANLEQVNAGAIVQPTASSIIQQTSAVKQDSHLGALVNGTAQYAITYEEGGIQKRFFNAPETVIAENPNIVKPKKRYWERTGDEKTGHYREIDSASAISYLKKKIPEVKKEPEAKPKEAAIKTFGAGISKKELADAVREVSKVSQDASTQVNEKKATQLNPHNQSKP